MAWLNYFGINSKRINETDHFPNFAVGLGKHAELDFSKDLEQIDGIWFRNKPQNSFITTLNQGKRKDITNYLSSEMSAVYSGFETEELPINILGESGLADINKISVLKVASKIGFKIPETLITNNKKMLQDFALQHPKIIVKPLMNPLSHSNGKTQFFSYTEILTLAEIEKLPDTFFPTLIQECIEKFAELRVFYLDGKKFCMAIFSQESDRTKTDYRKYNNARPNRTVPFQLPKAIEDKIDALMIVLKLNTGSLDIIYTPSGEYYFLEVNPVGQFGIVSQSCNYYLEKQIAEWLVN